MRARIAALSVAALIVTTLAPSVALAATVSWSTSLPTSGSVTIPAGSVVELDVDVDLEGLVIEGTLRCGSSDVRLRARWIMVSGDFECGTKQAPYAGQLTITLTGRGDGNIGGHGDKFLTVGDSGTLAFHGIRARSWTTLSETALAGSQTIHLKDPAWGPGDRLVIAPTSYFMEQAEEVTIVARRGAVVTLSEPLRRDHYCGTDIYAGSRVTECAEVGLLSHNIVIEGDAESAITGIGGHTMFSQGSSVHIDGVNFRRMGQFGRLARYPVHWHRAGHADGSIKRSSIEHSFNRFVTIHGTHDVTVKDVVGFDTVGHGFYLEDGIETGNRFIHNLAVLVRGARPAQAVTPSDVDASGFWISNPDNVLKRNAVGGAEFAGFWLAFPEHPIGLSATPEIWPRRTPLRSFKGNAAHTVGFAGLYVDEGENPARETVTTWYEPRVDPSDPESAQVTPKFAKFTAWKSAHYGIWIRTFSGARITKAVLADNWRSIYLANIASGPHHDNVGVIRSSVLVGTSSNHGDPEPWEVVDANGHQVPKHWDPSSPLGGISFYDGPMRVERSVLANFQPNRTRDAGALSSLFPNEFTISVLNEVEQLTFVNSNRVLLPDPSEGRQGDVGTLFTDIDGSVTGLPGSQVVVDQGLLDDGCTARPSWNAAVCRASFARVFVSRHDGRSIAGRVTRDDGVSEFVRGSDRGTSVGLNLRTDHSYVLASDAGPADRYTFWTDEFSGGSGVVLAVLAPHVFPAVKLWGPGRGRVQSLRDLTTGSAAWFLDREAGVIYFRFTPETRGAELG